MHQAHNIKTENSNLQDLDKLRAKSEVTELNSGSNRVCKCMKPLQPQISYADSRFLFCTYLYYWLLESWLIKGWEATACHSVYRRVLISFATNTLCWLTNIRLTCNTIVTGREAAGAANPTVNEVSSHSLGLCSSCYADAATARRGHRLSPGTCRGLKYSLN